MGGRQLRRSAEPLAPPPDRGEAFLDALDPRLSLEGTERAHDGVDQHPRWRGRIDLKVDDLEDDPAGEQPIRCAEGVDDGVEYAVEVKHDKGVAPPRHLTTAPPCDPSRDAAGVLGTLARKPYFRVDESRQRKVKLTTQSPRSAPVQS